jgi:hypothetical protein
MLRQLLAAPFEDDSRGERRSRGGAAPFGLARPFRELLSVRRLPFLEPRQPLIGAPDEPEPDHPDQRDVQRRRLDATEVHVRPELRAHDRGSENSDDDRPFEHELERGRQVRERGPRPQADRVYDRERDRLDRDPARMFPVAISMLCSIAAVTVIAISGRFVVTASRMAPASLPEMEAQGEHVGHP